MGKKKKVEVEVRAQMPIRVSAEEKEVLERAAALENLPTGTWMRTLALREAKRLLATE